MGRKSKYSPEFRAEVVEYFKTHNVEETMQKFGIPRSNVSMWALKAGFNKGRGTDKYAINFKHEVCQYYDNHTHAETTAKFSITSATLFKWRRTLGYRNKSRGYNLYTQEYRQQSRTPLHFKSVRGADGKYKLEVLQKRITDLEAQIVNMQPDVELAQSIRNLFN